MRVMPAFMSCQSCLCSGVLAILLEDIFEFSLFGHIPFIWKSHFGEPFIFFPPFSILPQSVDGGERGGWWDSGLICTHAFATCCVSVCAFQTRVLGTLCVPFSGEMRAMLSFADVNFLLLVFPHEKNGA